MKFTFTTQLEAGGNTYQDKVVVVASPSEVTWHIALKFLGYLLFFEQRPRIEAGIGWHYKPDLVVQDPHGRVTLWIDCGNIAVKKIDRVATWLGPSAGFFVMRRNRREAELLSRNMQGKVKHAARVTLLWFDEEVVDRLAGLLDSSNRCVCRRSGDRLLINISNRHGQHEIQTAVYRAWSDVRLLAWHFGQV